MGHRATRSAYLSWLGAALADPSPVSVTPGPAHHLVLGYATGYDASDIAPFVRSLRRVFDGPVALVVDDRPCVMELLAKHDVEAVAPETHDGWAPHPVVGRFAAFDRILQRYPETRSVLLTDVRDVLFQSAPFQPAPERLELYVEYEDSVLADHAFNMKHIRAVAGETLARTLSSKPCVCVGTVMGPRDEISRFCRTLLMLSAVPRSEVGGAFGADQAACNLALHLGLLNAEIKSNYGRVATLGMTCPTRMKIENCQVINPDGSVSPIVHQHDRHPVLMQALQNQWCHGVEKRQRVRPRSLADKGRKLIASMRRRTPELR